MKKLNCKCPNSRPLTNRKEILCIDFQTTSLDGC